MSIYHLDSSFRQIFPLFQQFSWAQSWKTQKQSKKKSFSIEFKVEFSRYLEQENKRLNKLTLLIVNSGVVPNLPTHSPFSPLKNWEPILSCPCIPSRTTCRIKGGAGVSHDRNHFFKSSWRLIYLLCSKKNPTPLTHC